MKPLFSLLFSFLFSNLAGAAACCGGASSFPSIIAGDDRAQFSSGFSTQQVVIDNVDSQGFWRQSDQHQQTKTLKFEGAVLISDLWQVGGSLPILERNRLTERSSGFGDLSTSLGYEYLPDWDYNPYRPKGISFLQLNIPFGLTKFESQKGGLDSRGSGLWTLGAGTLLTKTFRRWDFLISLEAHKSLNKKITTDLQSGELFPGWGGSTGFGIGYNTAKARFGGAITWFQEDGIDFVGLQRINGFSEKYATGSLSASYLWNDEWSSNLTYTDQTWFGHPENTSLSRGLGLQIQKKWLR